MNSTHLNQAGLRELFAGKQNILSVYIFGSYGTEFYHKQSDLDFAILFASKMSLLDEMAVIADISKTIRSDQIDLVNLNTASLRIKYRVLKTGKLIYEKNSSITDDFVEKTLNEYFDHEKMYLAFDNEYFRSFKEDYGNA